MRATLSYHYSMDRWEARSTTKNREGEVIVVNSYGDTREEAMERLRYDLVRFAWAQADPEVVEFELGVAGMKTIVDPNAGEGS